MSRRCFLKAAGAAAVIAAAGTLGCASPAGRTDTAYPTAMPTRAPVASGRLAVATDADPARLVDRAIDAYGGLSGVIKSGDRVVVKANFSWARTPAQGACNHPQVLARVMERCRDAGAAEVATIDYTIENGQACLEKSGVKKAVEGAGMKALAVRDAKDYVKQSIGGTVLESISVPKMLLDADVLIDVPVIKSHGNTRMTAGMKNLMGLVLERQYMHVHGLDDGIVDLARALRPDLVIADAYRVLKTGGPGGGGGSEVIEPHQAVVGDDMVAVDAYCARYLGLEPGDVLHVKRAHEAGLGEIDLSKISLVNA
jgi:uncharacterized protein (DUF362 family)